MDTTAINFNLLDDFFKSSYAEENNNSTIISSQDNNMDIIVNDNNQLENIEQIGDMEVISNLSTKQIIDKINNIKIELNQKFIEREELIDIMLLSLVAKTNLVMLGDPGTGKSKICYDLCKRIDDAKYFQWMLNKTSDPSEILGSFSVKEMENDKFMRITEGKLPEANIAFIDEVFKGNSPVLNSLLTIMNEHIFYNDGKPVDVPLISMFAASNEPPEDDSLMAMYDRFIFRINVEYIQNNANKKKMINNYIQERFSINNSISYTTITLDELIKVQSEVANVTVPKKIINTFLDLINNLKKNLNNFKISDRRINECIKVLQTSAVLDKRNVVDYKDIKSLKYVLWQKNSVDELNEIEKQINGAVNPFDSNFDIISQEYNEIYNKISNEDDTGTKAQLYLMYQNDIKSELQKLNKLINDASKSGIDTTAYNNKRDEILAFNENFSQEVLGLTKDNNDNDDGLFDTSRDEDEDDF